MSKGELSFMKALSILGALIFTWVNTNLSPLFWAVLGLALVEILTNLNNEQVVIQRMVKGTAAVLIPWAVRNASAISVHNPVTIKAAIAVVLIVQLTTVVPQLVSQSKAFLTKQLPKDKKSIDTVYMALEAEIEALKKQAKSASNIQPPGSSG